MKCSRLEHPLTRIANVEISFLDSLLFIRRRSLWGCASERLTNKGTELNDPLQRTDEKMERASGPLYYLELLILHFVVAQFTEQDYHRGRSITNIKLFPFSKLVDI